jgi:5-methylcytosine-specific restriction endonuclease McrA
MEQTLVLNASFEPLKVIDWQRAITLWCQGKVEIVAEHEREVRAVTFTFRLPSVVRLLRYVRSKVSRESVPFTRANIYRRDDYECQYCGESFQPEDLTFDHVVPAAHGGRRDWMNIVTACVPCNRSKGARTPAEAGMTLKRAPAKPLASPVFRVSLGVRKTPESWRDYLYWNVELETDLS